MKRSNQSLHLIALWFCSSMSVFLSVFSSCGASLPERWLSLFASSVMNVSSSGQWSVKVVENGRSGSIEYRESAGSISFYWEFGGGDTLPSFGLVTGLYGAPSILGRWINDGRYWSELRTRLFARKFHRVGLTLMRRVDTLMSVNLPPNQPVASLFIRL